MPEAQARAQVAAMADTLAGVATKSDLANLESRMDAKMSAMRADIRSDAYKVVAALAVGFSIVIARLFLGG